MDFEKWLEKTSSYIDNQILKEESDYLNQLTERKNKMKSNKIGTVELTTFQNEHNGKKFNSSKPKNSYFDKKDNEWKTTDNFSDEQLMALVVLINKHLESKIKVYEQNNDSKAVDSNDDLDDDIDSCIPF